ncbi:MAG TPA: hypothetical protein VLZ30_01590 [Verrucomicrobiae bacterium]|nr:hypothetical protein [Verrucomicrobiae bacterium]
MRRPISKLGALPPVVRDEINRKLSDGVRFTTITNWLFDQIADRDVVDLNLKAGESYSLAWTRDAKDYQQAFCTCRISISTWFRTHYQTWAANEEARKHTSDLIERAEKLTSTADGQEAVCSTEGGMLLVRSLLIDAIVQASQGKYNHSDIARLANAWARTSESGARLQGSIDVGLDALRNGLKDNPEAHDLFRKLRAALKHPAPPTP